MVKDTINLNIRHYWRQKIGLQVLKLFLHSIPFVLLMMIKFLQEAFDNWAWCLNCIGPFNFCGWYLWIFHQQWKSRGCANQEFILESQITSSYMVKINLFCTFPWWQNNCKHHCNHEIVIIEYKGPKEWDIVPGTNFIVGTKVLRIINDGIINLHWYNG